MTRDDRITFEVHSETKDKIRDKAEEKGLDLSGYCRMKLKEDL